VLKKHLIYELNYSLLHYTELLKLNMDTDIRFRIECIIADLEIQKKEVEKLDE